VADDAKLEALYQELILDHYRRPRNRGELPGASARVEHHNPLCGDEIDLSVAMDGERIGAVRATARGCSLSVAATSMLTERAPRCTAAELEALRARLGRLLSGAADALHDESLGELRAFAGVARVPARRRCVELGFEALERALSVARAR
jgi:nitrogen fixation NifU-like protein